MSPPRLLVVALVTTLLGVAGGAVARRGPDRPEHPPVVVLSEPAASRVDAVAVLRAWDARRATAWRTGDLQLLHSLYATGSRAGRSDRALLRAYVDRGLRVRDLRLQLLRVDALVRAPGRLVLQVTDRVASGEAVGRGRPLALPRDEPTTHRVVLREADAGWVVVAVRSGA